jgi:hypothetical protein
MAAKGLCVAHQIILQRCAAPVCSQRNHRPRKHGLQADNRRIGKVGWLDSCCGMGQAAAGLWDLGGWVRPQTVTSHYNLCSKSDSCKLRVNCCSVCCTPRAPVLRREGVRVLCVLALLEISCGNSSMMRSRSTSTADNLGLGFESALQLQEGPWKVAAACSWPALLLWVLVCIGNT